MFFSSILKLSTDYFNKTIFTVLKYIPFNVTPRLLIHGQWVIEDIYIYIYWNMIINKEGSVTHLDRDNLMDGRLTVAGRNLVNQTQIDHYLYEMFKVSWHDQNA